MKSKSVIDPVTILQTLIQLIHAADERIPVESLEFGTSVVYNTLLNYGGYIQ
jgi:acetylornithine deacetylase/succinyl-diaminopimelate desuccinylase-like protein